MGGRGRCCEFNRWYQAGYWAKRRPRTHGGTVLMVSVGGWGHHHAKSGVWYDMVCVRGGMGTEGGKGEVTSFLLTTPRLTTHIRMRDGNGSSRVASVQCIPGDGAAGRRGRVTAHSRKG